MREIRKNQKAKISIILDNDSEKDFECYVKEVHSDRIYLDYPGEILKYGEYMQEGSILPVKIYTPSGIKMYDAIVLNSPLDSDFVIEYVEDYVHVQRRKYPRVILETKVIIERETENIVTKTIDVGGGGIRFLSNKKLNYNEKVRCMLYLPMHLESIKAEGTIIQAPHLPQGQYIMSFEKIFERDRDKILKKCFELQAADYPDTGRAG